MAAGIVAAAAALFAASCGSPESSNSPLPTYTPTSDALYEAYSTALEDLDSVINLLDEARSDTLGKLEAAPEAALNAVQEAANCDVPTDSLANDPRDLLTAIVGIPADPRLRAAREAPRSIAQDLAAAHAASPANRTAIEDARSALVRAQLTGGPAPDDPALETYLDYLRNDVALANYSATLDDVNNAYLPVNDNLKEVKDDLIMALIQASEVRDCASGMLVLYEAYMTAFEAHRPALFAYFDGISAAIEDYAEALELSRTSYE